MGLELDVIEKLKAFKIETFGVGLPSQVRLLPAEPAKEAAFPPKKEPRPFLSPQAGATSIQRPLTERQKARPSKSYYPNPSGKISSSAFFAIPIEERRKLQSSGFLPSDKAFKKNKKRAWPEITRHVKALAKDASARSTRPSQRALPQPIQRTSAQTFEPKFRHTAILPPKPVLIIPRSVSSKSVGPKMEIVTADRTPMSDPGTTFRPHPTDLGKVQAGQLREVMESLAPSSYATLLQRLLSALEADAWISRTAAANGSPLEHATDERGRSLLIDVCRGRFGLFAYEAAGNDIARAARQRELTDAPDKIHRDLQKLRPMTTGLVTDVGRSRLMAWDLQGRDRVAVVRFVDLTRWLDGMHDGMYVPLRIESSVGSQLVPTTANAVTFLAEAAVRLRNGNKKVALTGRSRDSNGNTARARTNSRPTQLMYKSRNSWLIPLTVEGTRVTAGLDAGFFGPAGTKTAHKVRATMRRPKGSGPNAPKTEFVQAHVRGGYESGDIDAMPTVTILRDKLV